MLPEVIVFSIDLMFNYIPKSALIYVTDLNYTFRQITCFDSVILQL